MLDGNELRALIRDVIAAEIAAVKRDAAPAASAEHRVRISNDADLAAFAKQVLSLANDPATRSAIANGSYRFRLEGSASAAPSASAPASTAARIDKGVVTETLLLKLPKGTRRLQVGAGVSVTPLARDKAGSLGITIERMKP
jgi:hypothetical protein